MRIKNLFTGVISNERGDIARSLIRQCMAEQLEPEVDPNAPPKPGTFKIPAPKWEVTVLGKVYPELVIRMTLLGGEYYYSGKPENANEIVIWDGGQRFLNGFGRPIPENILKLYREQWKANPQLRAEHIAALRIGRSLD